MASRKCSGSEGYFADKSAGLDYQIWEQLPDDLKDKLLNGDDHVAQATLQELVQLGNAQGWDARSGAFWELVEDKRAYSRQSNELSPSLLENIRNLFK